MEGVYYLVLFLILVLLLIFGVTLIVQFKPKTNNLRKIVGVFLIIISILILFRNPISKLLTYKPTENDLIGTYTIIKADSNINKNNFKNYVLELKADNTFTLTPTPGISICDSGNYDLDFNFEYNELSFQCGQRWSPKHIKRKLKGFEIEFYLDFESGKSICFGKIQQSQYTH